MGTGLKSPEISLAKAVNPIQAAKSVRILMGTDKDFVFSNN